MIKPIGMGACRTFIGERHNKIKYQKVYIKKSSYHIGRCVMNVLLSFFVNFKFLNPYQLSESSNNELFI